MKGKKSVLLAIMLNRVIKWIQSLMDVKDQELFC